MLPAKLFYSTDISVTLWILNNNKKARVITKNGKEIHNRDRENEILFMDLRQMGTPFEKKYVELTPETRDKVTQTYHNWQQEGYEQTYKDTPEFCQSVKIADIKKYSLIPSNYIEFVHKDAEIDFDEEMSKLASELREILKERAALDDTISSLFAEYGYKL